MQIKTKRYYQLIRISEREKKKPDKNIHEILNSTAMLEKFDSFS